MATLTTTLSTGSSRVYPGSTVTVQTIVKVSGTETDAPEISFKWRMGRKGVITTVAPTRTGTGTYTVTLTPEDAGNLHYRWDTGGALDYSEEHTLSISDTRFDGNL